MNRRAERIAFIVLLLLTTKVATQGQLKQSPGGFPQDVLVSGSIMVSVWGPDHRTFNQQAVVSLYSVMSGTPIKTSVTSGPSQVVFTNLPGFGRYTIEVVSAGYRTVREDVDYSNASSKNQVDVTMQPVSANGSGQPASGLVPAVPTKAQKHVQKGIAELQAGNLTESEKELIAAYKAAPKNSYVCYLLGMLYVHSKDVEHAGHYLGVAINIDPNNVPALIALGQMRYKQGDYAGATDPLTRALSRDPKQWLADWLLADIHLRGGDYERARQEAEEAVGIGKPLANKAEFIEGEALVQLGRNEDAAKIFAAFLHDMPDDPAAASAREFLARLRPSDGPLGAEPVSPGGAATASVSSIVAAGPPTLEALLPTWEPLDVDRAKPLVADGVACPTQQVIDGASKRVNQLVENVNNITATEKIVYEGLDPMGRPTSTAHRDYAYLAFISDNDHGLPIVDEDRNETSDLGPSPQRLSPFALQGLALIFHPQLRGDFDMTCEGLGKWQQQATWIVYFRQRPDRPKRLRSYRSDQNSYSAGLKGRAWISVDSLQIVRMEADLMSPIPEVGLGSEEDAIEYGPVAFKSKKTELWLPIKADIYFYYRHHAYRRHHDFSNYMLFSVDSTQKISAPKVTDDN